MKIATGFTLAALSLASVNVSATMIANGDFASCDFSGWQKDTDGFGDISMGNDFAIQSTGTSCSAEINVDHFDTTGDVFGTPIDEAWFANTLYQELDFTTTNDTNFLLEIDFSVDTEANNTGPSFIADYFLIGLNDGMGNYFDEGGELGFLYEPTDINQALSQTVSYEIDSSFANQTGWFLDFQLNLGVDEFGFSDAYGSSFLINSVSLTEVDAVVSEPATVWLFSLGLIGLFLRNRRNSSRSI
ncbi:PEP-CTERM sorting domain-containing protein [Paraglaciecola sp. 2405UD69-4]|uniref:PEP-CTERM sorting domain-containing protein n=1 Tax=Paraglaciecola sp. 2405UD69-4 TaxID=3391836 RepID=UPI0039C9DB21